MLNRRQFRFRRPPPRRPSSTSRGRLRQAARATTSSSGGRVIDSSVRLDGIRDIAISQGASPLWMPPSPPTRLKPSTLVASWSSRTHRHPYAYRALRRRADACAAGRSDGWIDAGSQGADRIAETIAVARSSPQPGRVLINIGRGGILPEGGDGSRSRGRKRGAGCHRQESRVHRRREGAAVGKCGRERLRGASPRAGSRLVIRYTSDDPHGADGLAASGYSRS